MVKAMKVMKAKQSATSSSATIKSRGLVKGKNKKDPLPEEDVKKRPAAKKQRFDEDDAKSQLSTALSRTPSLNDKLVLLRGSSIPTAEKLKLMNMKLSHPEWNKLNGRFRTAIANDPELEETASLTPKVMMRALTSAWVIDPQKGEVFKNVACSISATATLTRDLKWESHKAMLKKWTQDELDLHINSGRIVWREDPNTAGVWEYKDTKNMTETRTITKMKYKSHNQNTEMVEDEFDQENKELEGQWNDTSVDSWWAYSYNGQPGDGGSKGGGKANVAGVKGKGKGGNIPSIEDDPKDPKKKLKAAKASLTLVTKGLGAWGFSQTKMAPKQKNQVTSMIKKLEAAQAKAKDLEEASTEEINEFVKSATQMASEAKKMME